MFTNCRILDYFYYICEQNAQCWARITKSDMEIRHYSMNFESLVGHINQVQDVLQAQAAHAVNLSLTARNWLVGYYIVEFEQHGEDRG